MSEPIYVGSSSQSIDFFIQDSSSAVGGGLTGLTYNSPGLKAYYRKGATGSATAITLATQTVGGAYSSGGFVEIDATNMPGAYRFDPPNAMIDSEEFVTLFLHGATNMAPTVLRIDCRALPADMKKAGGQAVGLSTDNRLRVDVAEWNDTPLATTNPLPNAAPGDNGGVPTVDASNYVAGIQGTINDLDGLDTAQDTQHSTTQSAVSGVPAAVEAAILNEGDATALLAAIAAKVEEFLINDGDATATLAAIATAVWAAGTRTVTAATNITSDGVAIAATAGVIDHVTLVDTTTTNTDMRGTNGANTTTPPTAAAIADAVWDEATADHSTAGTYGKGFTDILGRVTSAVYTMWTDLIVMITGTGGSQKFTTTALSNSPSGSGGLTEANLDEIVTRVRGVTVRGDVPAASRKGFDRPFYIGDVYTGNRKALLTITGWTGQDIADADSITLTADLVSNAATTFTWTANVVDATQTGSTVLIYFDLDATDTAQTAGQYYCQVKVVWGTEVVTVLDPKSKLEMKAVLD